jgi:hypothetical protein
LEFPQKKVLILDVDPGAKLENATNCTGHLGHQSTATAIGCAPHPSPATSPESLLLAQPVLAEPHPIESFDPLLLSLTVRASIDFFCCR